MSRANGAEYRIGRRAPYTMVPQSLLMDERADAYTIATYVALRSFADFGSTEGARPSDKSAAQRAGCSVRTFVNRRQRLKELGWLEWQSRAAQGKTNVYVIHETAEADPPPPVQEEESEGGGVQEMHTPSARGADPPMQEVHTGYAGDADNQEPLTEKATTTGARGSKNSTADRAPPAPEAVMHSYLQDHLESIDDSMERRKLSAQAEMILEGHDRKAWELPDGTTVPIEERPDLFRLALGYHADGTQRALRSSVRYVVGIYTADEGEIDENLSPADRKIMEHIRDLQSIDLAGSFR